MKKYIIVAYLILILVILISGFFIYNAVGKDNDSTQKIEEKTLAEIKYIENQFQNIFNQFNNISFENYKIETTEAKKEDEQKQSSSDSSQGAGGSKEENSQGTDNSETSENSGESDNKKQYNLKEKGILTKETEINWEQIKNEVEKTYTSIYILAVDIRQTPTNEQDILNFAKEYDNFTVAVKEEKKEESLKELSVLYDYLPKFVENCTDDKKENIIIKTKNEIFKAYSILDKEDWESISKNIDNAIQEYSKILTNINENKNINKYSANKTNIMLSELKNSVNLKEKEVFLIKYKNLLEELQNM